MKNSKVFTGKVLDVVRFDTSKMGNPRYILTIQNSIGGLINFYTPVNSSLGYEATNFRGKYVNFTSRFIYNKLCIDSIELDK